MKRLVFLTLITSFCCTALSAFPGLQQKMPAAPGSYVYYRDYSYKDPTYIGFLKYDNSAYSARFLQTTETDEQKIIQILFSLNPESAFFDMTGEKILTEVSSSDVDTLNYLHDLLYEFHSRRKKAEPAAEDKRFSVSSDFQQFGGQTTMSYSVYIPLFELEKITRGSEVLFELVCINTLQDDKDTSFTDFAGFPNLPEQNKKTVLSAKEQNTKSSNLESSWNQISESAWMLGEDAFIFSVETEIPVKEIEAQKNTAADFLIRYLLRTNPGNYLYYPSFSLTENKNSVQLSFLQYSATSQTFTNDFKIIQKKDTSIYTITGLSATNSFYLNNYFYFDKKLESLRK